jgi:cytoskeleton protein RodZ
MSESDNSELETHEPAAFGLQLMMAREKAGMTIDEAARALNLQEPVVEAIESSDFDKLPPIAFVKGYVRNYARLLDLSEEVVIRDFENELPRNLDKELQPRSFLPNEADSQTPVIKLISMLIVVSAVIVFIYAIYSYYIEKSETIEQANLSEQAEVLQPQTDVPLVQPQAEIDEDQALVDEVLSASGEADTLEYEASSSDETLAESATEVEELPQQEAEAEIADASTAEFGSEPVDEKVMPVPTVTPITGGDVLSISAEQESWAEIIDANDIRLFYGMIKPGNDLSLTGQVPFDVFLGNAPVVSLSLNDINIDMTKYIRSNNIAQFKVSVEDGRLRFY